MTSQDCSCLNDVYDEIFVISIKQRFNTLKITLLQLEDEHIDYKIWEGHSANNSHSISLWNKFRDTVSYHNISNSTLINDFQIIPLENNAYHNKYVFFLRQTQIDIMKYSLQNNLSKILIIEDDILLCNPYYFNLFCQIESSLPKWYVLNIGVNQYSPEKSILHNIRNYDNLEMKYSIKDSRSFGTFGISISYKMYPILISLFDFDPDKELIHQTTNLYALDNYYRFIKEDDEIKNKCFNIHPTLILPDVTVSSLRRSRDQMEFIQKHTTDGNVSHFSKHWNLRFNNFDELIKYSPSKQYLCKQNDSDYQPNSTIT